MAVTNASRHCAVLLAGGMSSRMGQDKALLISANQTLLDAAQQQLQLCNCHPIWISRNQPGFLQDRYSGGGPLAGIDAALSQTDDLESQYLLVLPVDMPLMNSDSLKTLQKEAELSQRPCFFEGSVLPAVLPISPGLKQYCRSALEGQRSLALWRLLKHFDGRAIPCPEPQRLINTNTPDEWQLFQQLQQ